MAAAETSFICRLVSVPGPVTEYTRLQAGDTVASGNLKWSANVGGTVGRGITLAGHNRYSGPLDI